MKHTASTILKLADGHQFEKIAELIRKYWFDMEGVYFGTRQSFCLVADDWLQVKHYDLTDDRTEEFLNGLKDILLPDQTFAIHCVDCNDCVYPFRAMRIFITSQKIFVDQNLFDVGYGKIIPPACG